MRASARTCARGTVAMLVALLLLLVVGSVPALAAQFQTGDVVTIGSGQVINDDLYVSGNSVVIDGRVTGSVFSVGGNVTVNGSVGGSLNAAGGTISVAGTVGKAVRLAGGTLHVSGRIGGDLLAMGSDVALFRSGSVGRDVVLGATTAVLEGSVGRNVQGNLGDLSISGPVGGNVEVEADHLTLKDGASVRGNVAYTSSDQAEVQPGVAIAGRTVHKEPTDQGTGAVDWWWHLLFLVWAFIVGAALVLLSPRAADRVAGTVRARPLSSLAFGVLALILPPLLILILGVTLVGLPLAAILLVAYVLAIYLAQVFVGLAIGEYLLSNLAPARGRWGLVLALGVGLVVLTILTALPIPVLGFVVQLVTVFLGLGALVLRLSRPGGAVRHEAVP